MGTTKERVQHTPGPWTVHHFVDDDMDVTECGLYEVEEANEQIKDLLAGGEIDAGRFIGDTNAHLIAAAPDLLAELKAMHEHHHPDCQGGCPTLAIIAKAQP